MKRQTPLILLCVLFAMAMLTLLVPMTVAQDTPAPTNTDFFAAVQLTSTPAATPGQAYLGAPQYPLAVLADGTTIPSLTGVGGKAERAPVAVRSGPGLEYPRIARVPQNGWIHITGWSGWDLDRTCVGEFAATLDMWVEVQTHLTEQRGWVARCVLTIVGDVYSLPIVSASGERDMQR